MVSIFIPLLHAFPYEQKYSDFYFCMGKYIVNFYFALCTTLQHICNTLHHTATHCNTLQHTATHLNTLQHTATHMQKWWFLFLYWKIHSKFPVRNVIYIQYACCMTFHINKKKKWIQFLIGDNIWIQFVRKYIKIVISVSIWESTSSHCDIYTICLLQDFPY